MAVQSFYTMDGNGRKKEKRKGHPPLTCLFSMRTCENYVQIRTNQFHQKIKMNKSKFERPSYGPNAVILPIPDGRPRCSQKEPLYGPIIVDIYRE